MKYLLSLVFASALFAQPAAQPLSQSILITGIALNQMTVQISVPFPFAPSSLSPGVLYVDNEAMQVVGSAVSLQTVTVLRGYLGTSVVAHKAGALVWSGYPSQFLTSDKTGSCDPNSPQFLNVNSTTFFTCTSGSWVSGTTSNGAAGSGITQLTGPVTAGPGAGSVAATLSGTGVSPGSCTNCNLTIQGDGRISVQTNGIGGAGSISIKTDNGASVGSTNSLDFLSATGSTWAAAVAGSDITVQNSIDFSVVSSRTNAQQGADNAAVSASGSPTAYTAAIANTFVYTNGMRLTWIPDVNCTGGTATTLNVNALGAKAIFQSDGATNPTSAMCTANVPRELLYGAALNTAAGAWVIH